MSWPSISLGDLANSVDYGVTASSTRQPVGPKFLRITDIQDDQVDWSSVPYCEIDRKTAGSKALAAGDILFARTGATTGKSFLISSCPEGSVFASYLIRVRPSERILSPFLAHFFRSEDYWRQISSASRGAAQPGVNSTVLQELRVPLPPLDEQRRIAAILDQADTLRRKRREALATIDKLQAGLFTLSFTGDASATWPVETVGDLATNIRTGPFGSQLLHSEFVDEGVAVLGIDNAVRNEFAWGERRYISDKKYQELKRYTVKPGDILITIMGTCGRCAIVPDDVPTAINTKHLCCITLDTGRALPQFLHAAFLQDLGILKQLGIQSKGAVMPGLNMGIIKSLQLRVPPISLQRRFAEQLEELGAQRDRGRDHLAHLDALFASLQHRAFRGEL